jgi:hypothetical protein
MPRTPSLLALLVLLAARVSAADPAVRTVELASGRVHLGDLVAGLPSDVAATDLGPSPPAGGSRLFMRDDIAAALPPSHRARTVPDGVRVTRKTQRLGAAELERLVRDALLRSGLPRGSTLAAVHPPPSVVVAAGFTRCTAVVPRPPRREGSFQATAIVDLLDGTETVAHLSVPLQLHLGPEAARPDVVHGSAVTLVAAQGSVEITTAAIVAADADVGESVTVTVRATGKTLRARIVARDRAVVEGNQ